MNSVSRAAPLPALDRVESISDIDNGTEIVASRLIRADDPYLSGHYPDFTIYPGVFILESVTQAVETLARSKGASAELTAIDSVRFTNPVLPGDTLRAVCRCTHESGKSGTVLAVLADCHTGEDTRVAHMRLTFTLGEPADG